MKFNDDNEHLECSQTFDVVNTKSVTNEYYRNTDNEQTVLTFLRSFCLISKRVDVS